MKMIDTDNYEQWGFSTVSLQKSVPTKKNLHRRPFTADSQPIVSSNAIDDALSSNSILRGKSLLEDQPVLRESTISSSTNIRKSSTKKQPLIRSTSASSIRRRLPNKAAAAAALSTESSGKGRTRYSSKKKSYLPKDRDSSEKSQVITRVPDFLKRMQHNTTTTTNGGFKSTLLDIEVDLIERLDDIDKKSSSATRSNLRLECFKGVLDQLIQQDVGNTGHLLQQVANEFSHQIKCLQILSQQEHSIDNVEAQLVQTKNLQLEAENADLRKEVEILRRGLLQQDDTDDDWWSKTQALKVQYEVPTLNLSLSGGGNEQFSSEDEDDDCRSFD